MSKTIKMTLDAKSIANAIKELQDYQSWLHIKANELSTRLADMGSINVSLGYSRAIYTGPKDTDVTVEDRGNNTYAIVASGETVLILEFGAGVTYGDGHPQAAEFGYGPGTYPGQTHAMDPRGWYLPKEKGGGHTFGNAPSMTMYQTAKDLREDLERIAREVFSS